MVVQIALGVILAIIILTAGGAIVSAVMSTIGSAVSASAETARRVKREAGWRAWWDDHPAQQRTTEFSAALVESWRSELESRACSLDGSYNFSGGRDLPSDRDFDRAYELRRIAVWLLENASTANASGIDQATWQSYGRRWMETMDAVCRGQRWTAQQLEDPKLHWHVIESAATLESLSVWIAEHAPRQEDDNRASRPATSYEASFVKPMSKE